MKISIFVFIFNLNFFKVLNSQFTLNGEENLDFNFDYKFSQSTDQDETTLSSSTLLPNLNPTLSQKDLTSIDLNEYELGKLTVVWEKSRKQMSNIFESVGFEKNVSLSYDPRINVLIYKIEKHSEKEKQVLKLDNLADNLIFFQFNEPDQLSISLNCPDNSHATYYVNFDSRIQYLKLSNNTKHFPTLKAAIAEFKCSTSVTVKPGTFIYLNIQQESLDEIDLFSFILDKERFSVSLQHLNNICITTTSQEQISDVVLNRNNITSYLYLYFTEFGIQFYLDCPQDLNEWSAYWNTTIFENGLKIKTSCQFYYLSPVLLHTFCGFNSLIKENNISKESDKLNIDFISDVTEFFLVFSPDLHRLKQIEMFYKIHNNNLVSFSSLIENDPKILFASRKNAKADFFHRNLNDYAQGFSDDRSNLWLGLETLHQVTSQNKYKLRIVATLTTNFEFVEEYSWFQVGSAEEGYLLNIGELSTCCGGYFEQLNGTIFSAYDSNVNSDLARKYLGGFWHTDSKQKYCFSCVDDVSANSSSTNVWLSNGKDLKVFQTKMYLVVIVCFKFFSVAF